MDDTAKRTIIDELNRGAPIEEACARAGVTPRQVAEARIEDRAFDLDVGTVDPAPTGQYVIDLVLYDAVGEEVEAVARVLCEMRRFKLDEARRVLDELRCSAAE